jgi:hypothetical protein
MIARDFNGIVCWADTDSHPAGKRWAVITQLRDQWSDLHGFSPGDKKPA